MAPTPFVHGLALAWSDGALSRDGAIMLETLQQQLGLSDSERAMQEQVWLAEISKTSRRSFGDGDQNLREWLEGLNDCESLAPTARSMGRAAVNAGISKSGWAEALLFAEGLGLGNDLAEGISGDFYKTLFLCGEHTTFDYAGTVHGAYFSGLWAAEMIAGEEE